MTAIPVGDAKREIGFPIHFSYTESTRPSLVPELRGQYGRFILEQMARSDETVGAMMITVETSLTALTWNHVPQKNGKDCTPDDPDYKIAKAAADFADSMLSDMDHTIEEHVEEACTMVWAGFAPHEIVTKQRVDGDSKYNDGLYGLKGLPLRDQLTVYEWKYEGRKLISMLQTASIGVPAAETPMWKLLHYRARRTLDNPWGVSLLTNAHRPWYLKQRVQDAEAIGIERDLAGLPVFSIPEEDLVAAADVDSEGKSTPGAMAALARIRAAQLAVRDMRFNEAGGLVLPSDTFQDEDGRWSANKKYEFKIVTTSGQRAIDTRAAARDYDRAIARLLLMQFLHIGDRAGGGGTALADNQTDLALRSLKALAGRIRGEYSRKVIPIIWAINAASGMPMFNKRFMPRLQHSRLTEDSLKTLGAFLESIGLASPLFEKNPRLLNAVLDRAGLDGDQQRYTPDPTPSLPEVPEDAAAGGGGGGSGGSFGGG